MEERSRYSCMCLSGGRHYGDEIQERKSEIERIAQVGSVISLMGHLNAKNELLREIKK